MQVFVTNSPTLLANGATVENIAVGQVGIIDAKSNSAVTSPTYAKNKAFKVVWGTPDLGDLPLMSGVPNENEYSKLIKGKRLVNFQGNAAKRGQSEIWTVGFSGDEADTDSLFGTPGEIKNLFIKLTGGPIDKLFSKQGIIRQFSSVVRSTAPDCDDPCAQVDPRLFAEDLVKQINADPLIGVNGSRKNKGIIKASVVTKCDDASAITTDTDYIFELSICDTQDDIALGIVQAAYPDDVVKRVGTVGSSSIYQIVSDTNSAPDDFSNEAFTVIPDCDVCPSGYTSVVSGQYGYQIVRSDAGTGGALTTLASDYGITGDELASRVNYEFGSSTYIVTSVTELTASGVDTLTLLSSDLRGSCVLTDPTESSWNANGTLTKYAKTFTITLADNVCGESRLAELQEAYPDLTIALVAGSTGECVRSYSTSVFSQAIEVGCSLDQLVWTVPQAFDGIQWKTSSSLEDLGTCLAGIKLEVAFVNRVTGECTFDYFPYEAETIHIQVSNFNPDYNAHPDEESWAVKQVQAYQHPSGFGAEVRKLEKVSKSYALRERSFDPVVREIEGYSFQADPNKYYDEYVLSFAFDYKVGGWSDEYSDKYRLYVYFPEGQGKSFEAAINGYMASAAIQIDPVVL